MHKLRISVCACAREDFQVFSPLDHICVLQSSTMCTCYEHRKFRSDRLRLKRDEIQCHESNNKSNKKLGQMMIETKYWLALSLSLSFARPLSTLPFHSIDVVSNFIIALLDAYKCLAENRSKRKRNRWATANGYLNILSSFRRLHNSL